MAEIHAGTRSRRVRPGLVGLGALVVCGLTFGPGIRVHAPSVGSPASAPNAAGAAWEFGFPKAYAESRRLRRIRRKREAERKAAAERQKEADSRLLDNRLAELPASCKYDSFASFFSETDVHVCGAYYYRPFEEDGVTGYQGHPINADPEEVKRAQVRRAKAKEKRLAEAEKKLKAQRKTELESDCAYDSIASFAERSNVYSCGGVQFMQVMENGVMVFDRRGPGSVSAKTKHELALRAKARAKSGKAAGGNRVATLPQGCTYDSYASFFASSNIYSCAGVRYRQYQDSGAGGFEQVDL